MSDSANAAAIIKRFGSALWFVGLIVWMLSEVELLPFRLSTKSASHLCFYYSIASFALLLIASVIEYRERRLKRRS